MSTPNDAKSDYYNNKRGIICNYIIGFICVLFVFFQLYTAGFGQFPNLIQRAIHAAFGIGLAFLALPTFKKSLLTTGPNLFNVFISVIFVLLCFYIVFSYDRLMVGIGKKASTYELLMGILLIILSLEAARRSTGFLLPLMVVLLISYSLFGNYIPGYWGHRGFQLDYIIEYLYLGPEGIWGGLTGISATIVASFIIFGSILLATGGAGAFMQVALLLGGRSNGGAAKVSLVGSALFGMLSGSAIANVATTGNFTIPMMKRLKYPPHFAAGVEATASSGGQITPPIMGAGAFIMSELIAQPYLNIVIAATLPALLFYICVWVSIDLEARKMGLARIPPEEIPSARSVLNWKTAGPVGITIVVLLITMFMGYTPSRAAFFAVITNLILFLFLNPLNKADFIKRIKAVYLGMELAGRGMIVVVGLLVCAQIAVSMISLSGIGVKMSELVISIGAGNMIFTLFLAAVVSMILGMGIPTTAAYVLAASVVAPALQVLGVAPLPAHLFIFYCAILSGLTPPVCTAVFAAASIAEADWMKVAWASIRLAVMKYILPFFFVFRPSLLMIGEWSLIVRTVIVTIISSYLIAIATVGYYRKPINFPIRFLLMATGMVLIIPGVIFDVLGISLLCILLIYRFLKDR